MRILIVCEGAETEPLYFNRFRIKRRLSTELLRIVGGDESGSHPKNVVKYAKSLKRAARQERFDYDHVWCVFDRDQHESIHEALEQARANKFDLAFSNPCFELWYLLHFQDQGAHIERDAVVRKLKSHIHGYTKSMNVYDNLEDKQEGAIRRARDLRRQHTSGEHVPPNPYTDVDELVELLNQLDTPGLPAQADAPPAIPTPEPDSSRPLVSVSPSCPSDVQSD